MALHLSDHLSRQYETEYFSIGPATTTGDSICEVLRCEGAVQLVGTTSSFVSVCLGEPSTQMETPLDAESWFEAIAASAPNTGATDALPSDGVSEAIEYLVGLQTFPHAE